MTPQSVCESCPCVLHIKIDVVSEMLVSLTPNYAFHPPVVPHLENRHAKTIEFFNFRSSSVDFVLQITYQTRCQALCTGAVVYESCKTV